MYEGADGKAPRSGCVLERLKDGSGKNSKEKKTEPAWIIFTTSSWARNEELPCER